jgi:hypothetical protein
MTQDFKMLRKQLDKQLANFRKLSIENGPLKKKKGFFKNIFN